MMDSEVALCLKYEICIIIFEAIITKTKIRTSPVSPKNSDHAPVTEVSGDFFRYGLMYLHNKFQNVIE